MKSVEKIWAELSANASTELSEEVKVELGAIQDIEKMVGEAEQLWKSTESKVGNILRNAMDKVQSEVKPMVQLRVKLFNVSREFDTKADELGLDSSTKSKYLSSVENAIKALDKRIDYLGEVNSAIINRF
jgi:chromosome segregation ATPase